MSKTKMEFRPNDFVVYPAHGVGQIVSIEEQEIPCRITSPEEEDSLSRDTF